MERLLAQPVHDEEYRRLRMSIVLQERCLAQPLIHSAERVPVARVQRRICVRHQSSAIRGTSRIPVIFVEAGRKETNVQ